jgi:hypothetical protein
MLNHRKLTACLKATMVLAQPIGQLYGPHGQPRPSCRPVQGKRKRATDQTSADTAEAAGVALVKAGMAFVSELYDDSGASTTRGRSRR